MTDKQIIIDGIDVSGCCQYMPRYMEDYDIDTLDYCRQNFKPCEDVDVKYCYYKQLKHKEQECERLKEDIERWKSNFNGKVSAIEELLQQLDQLKKTLTEIKEICNSVENIENINSLYDAKLSGMYLQAHKILQKISECEVEND